MCRSSSGQASDLEQSRCRPSAGIGQPTPAEGYWSLLIVLPFRVGMRISGVARRICYDAAIARGRGRRRRRRTPSLPRHQGRQPHANADVLSAKRLGHDPAIAPVNVSRHPLSAGIGILSQGMGRKGFLLYHCTRSKPVGSLHGLQHSDAACSHLQNRFFDRLHGCLSSCDDDDAKGVPGRTEGQVPPRSNSCAACIQWFAIWSIMVLCSSCFARAAQREHCAAKARYSLGEPSAGRMILFPRFERFV